MRRYLFSKAYRSRRPLNGSEGAVLGSRYYMGSMLPECHLERSVMIQGRSGRSAQRGLRSKEANHSK